MYVFLNPSKDKISYKKMAQKPTYYLQVSTKVFKAFNRELLPSFCPLLLPLLPYSNTYSTEF